MVHDIEYQGYGMVKVFVPRRSSVEFFIEKQAEPQCFISMGICEGTHEYKDGRSALAAEGAWMLSTQRYFSYV